MNEIDRLRAERNKYLQENLLLNDRNVTLIMQIGAEKDKIKDLEENKENLIKMFDQRTRDYEWKDTECKTLEEKVKFLEGKLVRMNNLTYRHDGNWERVEEI